MTTPKPPAPTPAPTPTPRTPPTGASPTPKHSTTTEAPTSTAESAESETTEPASSSAAASSTPASSTPSSTSSTPSSTTETTTSTVEPTPDPDRPKDAGPAALFDALAAEHAAIYGYGLVSAHVLPDENDLVSESLAQHRDRREAAVTLMNEQSIKPPLPAAGYQLPMVVSNANNAAKLAVRLESDCAVAWRAVLEQTDADKEREFGTKALTQCAVLAARWRRVLGAWPVTEAFPGGSE